MRARKRHRTYVPNYMRPMHKDRAIDECDSILDGRRRGRRGRSRHRDRNVRVLRIVNVADGGRPINPKIARTQLSGAAIMQIGFTLTENMEFDGGQVTKCILRGLQDSGLSRRAADGMLNSSLRCQETGPFGAKGIASRRPSAYRPP